MEPIEFPFSKPRLFVTGLIGLTLPVTLVATVHFARDGNWSDAVPLAVLSVPLVLVDWWVWRRLLTNRPAVVLTADALIDRSSFFPAGRVDRTRIAGIRIGETGFWACVLVDFHDPLRRYGRKSATIVTFLLQESAEALAHDLEEWLRAGRRY